MYFIQAVGDLCTLVGKCSGSYLEDSKTVVTSYQLKCCSILTVKSDGGHVFSCYLMVGEQSTSLMFAGCSVTDIMQANQFPKPNGHKDSEPHHTKSRAVITTLQVAITEPYDSAV